jgi:hypothetical protein
MCTQFYDTLHRCVILGNLKYSVYEHYHSSFVRYNICMSAKAALKDKHG